MEQKQTDKVSMRSELIIVLLSVTSGSCLGWLIWLATSNIAVTIGMAGALAALSKNLFSKVIK